MALIGGVHRDARVLTFVEANHNLLLTSVSSSPTTPSPDAVVIYDREDT
jgi:hypothetical protein